MIQVCEGINLKLISMIPNCGGEGGYSTLNGIFHINVDIIVASLATTICPSAF
jgi:hypothetical protein